MTFIGLFLVLKLSFSDLFYDCNNPSVFEMLVDDIQQKYNLEQKRVLGGREKGIDAE